MSFVTRLTLLGLALVLLALQAYAKYHPNSDLDDVWHDYKKHHVKKYKSKDHESQRRRIFEDNMKLIQKHNVEADLGKHHHRLGLTKFSDWTPEEFKQFLTYRSSSKKKNTKRTVMKLRQAASLPDTVNWVQQGAVTAVKNQDQCGGCYAFSATGALEGQVFMKTGKLIPLSEQNLLDCSTDQGNNGCGGGDPEECFNYVNQNGGLDTEDSYPFTSASGDDGYQCNYNSQNSQATCSAAVEIESGNEQALAQSLSTVGPISISINSSGLQQYATGVLSLDNCPNTMQDLDHSVLLVGYGTASNGQQYWLIKNSWDTDWGMNGYLELARNQNNMCGVATQAVYPQL